MRVLGIAAAAVFLAVASFGQMVSFKLEMNHASYVLGEEVVVSLRIANKGVTPVVISDFEAYKDNKLFFEIVNHDKKVVPQFRKGAIVEELSLEKDEGEVITVNLSEWYLLTEAHYQIKAVLFCNGLRYESPLAVFDVVPGIELASVSHYVSLKPAVERTLRLVYWGREGRELAFLRADDKPTGVICRTLFLGDIMRVKKPSIEKKKNESGVFFIYRQATRDVLARTEVESDADGIRIKDLKRAVESASSPMIDSLREAVERKASKKK